MTSTKMQTRVRRTLAINHKVGLTFPCVFMRLTGRETGKNDLALEFEDDATFRDGEGELSLPALGVLADEAVGTVIRKKAGPTMRLATVHLELQMTGASSGGHVVAQGHFLAFSERQRVRQALSTALIKSGDTLIAHASAAFVLFELPKGKTQVSRPWLTERFEPEALDATLLDPAEHEALRICGRAEAAATRAVPFIEHFWGGIPKAGEGKANLTFKVAPHLGNRVGHVHGGLMLGTAARVANAAVAGTMRLSNISAWFVSPGLGPRLKVRSRVVHQGRNLAVVRTQIVGASGKLVLETTSQHVATAG